MEPLHLLLGLCFAALAVAAFVREVFDGRPLRQSLKGLVVNVFDAVL